MKPIGLIFPGQGAQAVGMGRELAESHPAARKVFATADAELGFKLSRLCWEGPLEELSRSDVAQPAILTASIAALRALTEAAGRFPPVRAAAGLSLGEYSALVAAGALAFPEAVRLVRRRGAYMQEACESNPGGMYSILGLEDEIVEEACSIVDGPVWPANYNCPGQLVISGEHEPAREAAALCQARGARRVIRLDVAGAYHTPLMAPAAQKMRQALDEAKIQRPRYPVVANVTGRPVDEPDEIRALLVRQITSPVRWADAMRWTARQGVSRFYELGPGRVLRGLLGRIDRELSCETINRPEGIQQVIHNWQKGEAP